jgi:hypothetical protein
VRDYSPFDHTQDMEVVFDPFLDDKTDMASLIQSVGEYMTANEARDRLGLSDLEDEEMGESFRTPEDIESPDDQPDGGLFGSAAEEAVDNELENRDLQDIEDIPLDDYPEAAQENARMALDAREETGNPNDCLTDTGWAVANNLDSGDPISQSQLESMSAFERFEDDKEQGEEGRADCGWMAWKAWGGDEGIRWAENKQEEFEEARENSELSGETDFRHSVDTDGWEAWEHTLYELHQQAFEADGDVRLANFTERALPDFVKDRLQESIMQGAIFSQFDTLVENDIMQLREFMTEELTQNDGWTTDSIAGRLMDLESELSRQEAEVIARSETASVVNSAREQGYKEQGMEDERFAWVGSLDDRTTEACRWLIEKTNPRHGGEPVPLDELKELIAEAPTHDPEMDDNLARPDDFVVHPQERKTFTRQVDG